MEKEFRNMPTLKGQFLFTLVHVLPFIALYTGATKFDWILCVSLYFVRMFFVTGVYHRYFAHRTYKTSRIFQAILAFGAETTVQKGVLWWAAHHRVHHKTSDTAADPHSMKIYGFWYSHLGWILGPDYKRTETELIPDYAKFKEIKWLNEHHLVPPFIAMAGVMIAGGFVNQTAGLGFIDLGSLGMFSINGAVSALLIGFLLSTVFLYHGTFSINSIMHYFGKARYKTGEESKNNLILALITMGEGWHNNHHYYMSSTRQGFFWWEIDPTYYILKLLSFVGLVWDIQEVPKHIKYSTDLEHAKKLKEQYAKEEKAA